MNKLFMHVYEMKHPDGTPRKYWCYVQTSGNFTTRCAAANAKLQENVKPAISDPWKVAKKKENEGYVFLGEYMVSDQIHWNETSPNQPNSQPQASPPAPQPAQPTKSKFDDAILHWSAKKLSGDWQFQVSDALFEVVNKDDIVVTHSDATTEIAVIHKTIILKELRSQGSVTLGDGDWMTGLILLRLAKFLPISVVDDSSNPVERRNLKSRFVEKGHLFMNQGSSMDEYDDFATRVGLVPRLDTQTMEAITNFF